MPPPAKTNADVVRQALIALQNLRPAEAAQYWVPGFHLNCNGKHLDNAASFEMFQERQARFFTPRYEHLHATGTFSTSGFNADCQP
jgi:hypothetical protein